jgi:hypothetical protein
LALNADWDNEILSIELGSLQSANFNIELLGFDAIELSDLFDEQIKELKSNAEEIDTDEYDMNCKCPKCGFEFDAKT